MLFVMVKACLCSNFSAFKSLGELFSSYILVKINMVMHRIAYQIGNLLHWTQRSIYEDTNLDTHPSQI